MEVRSKLRAPLPWHGWILTLVFLLYGLASCFDHVMSTVEGESYWRSNGMTDAQVAYFHAVPFWAVTGWTFAVWGSFLGSVALLLRSQWAQWLFTASVAGSSVHILYSFALSSGREAMGVLWPMPFIITAMVAGMAIYSRRLKSKNVLT